MLAALLLLPGRTASSAELIDALWGEEPPSRARSILRTYAWRWRRVLDPESADGAASEVLVSLAGGYRLALPAFGSGGAGSAPGSSRGATDGSAEPAGPPLGAPAAFDGSRFDGTRFDGTRFDGSEAESLPVDAEQAERWASDADKAGAEGRPEQARELLRRAVDLWTGVPLAGVPGPFAERQRRRFAELRLSLLERRIALDVELGRGASCVPELRALSDEFPLRERLYALLMRALSQSGRQADALAAFTAARRLLIGELGVEPGAELRAVHAEVLAGGSLSPSPSSRSSRSALPPAAASSSMIPAGQSTQDKTPAVPRPAQLPPAEPDFVGRGALAERLGAELSSIEHKYAAPAVLALAGMGGVGKSTLALHIAHRARPAFPDGQLYADLHGTGASPVPPQAVLEDFLHALGVPAQEIPEGTAARSSLFRTVLDGRRLLIVLDDAANAAQVRPLLPGAAGCAVLVTSRARLVALPKSAQVWLDVFDDEEALGLLGRVAGPERPHAEPEAARLLVDACGRLPLAVRIVAARLAARPAWTVASLAGRLADERSRLRELRIGELAVAPAFEVGYQQLTALQATAFRLLGAVEAVEIGLPAAAAVLALPEADAEAVLESLVDVAMLESPAEHRYRHHSLLRDFAHGAVGDPDRAAAEGLAARSRLLRFLLAGACAAFESAVPGDPIRETLAPQGIGEFAFDSPAAARAWARGEAATAAELTARIATEALGEGAQAARYRELVPAAINLLIAMSPFGPGPWGRRTAIAVQDLARAAERAGDVRGQGRAWFLAGNTALAAGRFDEASQHGRWALELCTLAEDPVIARQVLNDLGVIAHGRGAYDEAAGLFGEAVALARALGHHSGEAGSLLNMAVSRLRAGRAAEVLADCEGMLASARERGDPATAAQTRYVSGLALAALARPAEAAERFETAATDWNTLGALDRAARARFQLAKALHTLGADESARDHAHAALAEFEADGHAADQRAVRALLADLDVARD
ncbi:BTAD domain-containing putative transcriptional regulator [Catenulispora sp. EB89]|uniref:AfsR/SARP family transcriptional regulator n=1 Tax=Catenulispora sp. EB89 TaxID=3156257 RepID=UPI0035129B9C